jgi:hypothetical protein
MEAGSGPALEAVRDTDTPGRHTGSAIIGACRRCSPLPTRRATTRRAGIARNSMPNDNVINASVSPKGSLETLSQREVQQLSEVGPAASTPCSASAPWPSSTPARMSTTPRPSSTPTSDFEVRIHQQDRGVRLELLNAPADAFVDGEMIASTREMLFSALRDIVYTETNWTASAST